VPQPTIIPFYAYRMLLADLMAVFGERGQKAVPVVRRYPVIAYSQSVYPFFQFQSCFQVPFPPYKGHYFPRIAVVGVNKPYFVLLFTHVSPEFVYFQAVIVTLFWLYRVFPRFEHF
jgi:hypothetical protein